MYDGNDWMIAWNGRLIEGSSAIEVGPWPDSTGWSNTYAKTTGCCNTFVHDLDDAEQARLLVNQAVDLMFDGIPPEMVLTEFAKIRVWREMKVDLLAGYSYKAFLPGKGYESWNPWH